MFRFLLVVLPYVDARKDEMGSGRRTGFPGAGQLVCTDFVVHGRHGDDGDGQWGARDLSDQNWELGSWAWEIARGLILSGHAMGSRAGIHPSDWHVLRDCNPSL